MYLKWMKRKHGNYIRIMKDVHRVSQKPVEQQSKTSWDKRSAWNSSVAFALLFIYLFFPWRCDPTRVMTSSFLRFLDHTQRRTIVGRTPLDE